MYFSSYCKAFFFFSRLAPILFLLLFLRKKINIKKEKNSKSFFLFLCLKFRFVSCCDDGRISLMFICECKFHACNQQLRKHKIFNNLHIASFFLFFIFFYFDFRQSKSYIESTIHKFNARLRFIKDFQLVASSKFNSISFSRR